MSKSIRVICPECGDVVEHHCGAQLRQALVNLLTWTPESGVATEGLEKAIVKAGVEHGWIDPKEKVGDRFKQPFFGSQAWSYPIFGDKGTARSFHALIHSVCRAAGVDPDAVMRDFYSERDEAKRAEEERKAGVQKRKDERTAISQFLKDKAVPLDARIAKLDELLTKQATVHKLVPFKEGPDGFCGYLLGWLQDWYGGGISAEVNRARVSKLEGDTFDATHPRTCR